MQMDNIYDVYSKTTEPPCMLKMHFSVRLVNRTMCVCKSYDKFMFKTYEPEKQKSIGTDLRGSCLLYKSERTALKTTDRPTFSKLNM